MPGENENVEEFPLEDNKEGSLDLSDTNQKLTDIIDILSKEIDIKNKKEEEQKKKLEEEQKKIDEETKKINEEVEKDKEQTVSTVQTVVENTSYLESINTLIQEQVFLHKLGFVGLGVGIALVSVLIFQNSFKR